jgi:hypothetical protein
MSEEELGRVAVMARVQSGDLKLGRWARLLGVSYRQAKRIGRKFRDLRGSSMATQERFRTTRGRNKSEKSFCHWCASTTAERWESVLDRRWLPSTWKLNKDTACMPRRCGNGCWLRA